MSEPGTAGQRSLLAALNNADLCEPVFRAHGLRHRRTEEALICLDPPPPYFPDLITLCPSDGHRYTEAIDELHGLGKASLAIKDSFSTVDHESLGLKVLFDARWIWRTHAPATMPEGWKRVETHGEFKSWCAAWSKANPPADVPAFPGSCLDLPDLIFMSRIGSSGVEAGCLANLSMDVVGISNVFVLTHSKPPMAEMAAAIASVAQNERHSPLHWPVQRTIVGYERGDMLNGALQAGFEDVGPLRILTSVEGRD
ncbi:MAG: hypothetical protein AAFY73_10870 [Pseudomonadota bacterium]